MDTRVVSIGNQDFEKLVSRNSFYVDKTHFIKEWWESEDDVTLITRLRRFGKTLLMSMVEKFFSLDYEGKSGLFEGLSIFEEDRYRELQGTYPVISLNFASIKSVSSESFYRKIQGVISEVYHKKDYLLKSEILDEEDKNLFTKIRLRKAEPEVYEDSLQLLSDYLSCPWFQ